jgi:hypothetical protein
VEILGPGLSCFGVFDGHGEAGGLVSNYVATKLPNKIREVLSLTHPGHVFCQTRCCCVDAMLAHVAPNHARVRAA